MSDYKRITNENWQENYDMFEGVCCDTCTTDCGECELNFNALVRLAQLEDKIKAGTLIELPCKVGDTIYIPWSWENQVGIAFVKVKEIHSIANGCFAFTTTLDSDSVGFIKRYGCEYLFNDIGKYIFLTKEQAEQRLKELKDEL